MPAAGLRLFVAVDLPTRAVEHLVALQPAAAPGLRIVAPDQMHLTLLFLGRVKGTAIGRLETALAAIACAPFMLDFVGVGWFVMNEAEFLWAGLVPTPALTELHARVGAVVRQEGIALEERAYTPHVTLARGEGADMPAIREEFLTRGQCFELRGVRIEQFSLYSSSYVGKTPTYKRRRAVSLGTTGGVA
jgi:2'-5' RNA ligase